MPIKQQYFTQSFIVYIYIYIYIPRQASAKYYKKNKEKIKKSLVKGIKIFLKKKKTERENMVVNGIKISQKMKNKS